MINVAGPGGDRTRDRKKYVIDHRSNAHPTKAPRPGGKFVSDGILKLILLFVCFILCFFYFRENISLHFI